MSDLQDFDIRPMKYESISLEPAPAQICPDCYSNRDQVVVLLTMDWRDIPVTLPDGERVSSKHSGSVKACLVCRWSEEGESDVLES